MACMDFTSTQGLNRMLTIKNAVLIVLIIMLVGCRTTKGPPQFFSADGASKPSTEVAPYSLAPSFYAADMRAACASLPADQLKYQQDKNGTCAGVMAPCVADGEEGAGACTSVADRASISRDMFDVGSSLVYANCSDFFANAGRTQTVLMVAKDLVGVFGTLAGGVLALDGNSTGDLDRLAGIGLVSSFTLSTIDVYTQRFLFAAENVDSVRELTLGALMAHAKKVQDDPPRTYLGASRHLLDNQALCLPPRIALLAREAIKNGTVVAYTVGDKVPPVSEAMDRLVLQDIGRQVGIGAPLTMRQAAGYYWLLVQGAADADVVTIRPLMQGIEAKYNPTVDNGPKKASPNMGPEGAYIRERLDRLSPQSVTSIINIINDEKQKVAVGNGASAPAPGAIQLERPADIERSRVRIEVQ